MSLAASSILSRCALLRCPACGGASIFRAPFKRRHHCAACGALFEREEGYFVGAISVNVMTTELVILVVYILCLLTIDFDETLIFVLLLPLALLFPVAFYHHSWSIWLSFDHLVETLPGHGQEAARLRPREGDRRP